MVRVAGKTGNKCLSRQMFSRLTSLTFLQPGIPTEWTGALPNFANKTTGLIFSGFARLCGLAIRCALRSTQLHVIGWDGGHAQRRAAFAFFCFGVILRPNGASR